uniref:Eco57I restriction-modification methylase domain-containing protein n=1 Tax=Halococcus saccharolyticus TaxID=62319 RepID=UPI001F4C7DD7|nr:DNA methyltransferase [Halococcus saccharolyticus]
MLESGDLETFKYFYLFFQHEAFLPDTSGDCFLDDVYSESNVFAEELGEDLQDNIYDAIQSLAEGFLTYPDNDLGADDLDLIHDSSLIYLYRLIFVLYAESEGRDLLNTDNEIYEQSYSLNTIKQEIAEELDSDSPSYQNWQDNLWDRIDELFQLIDQGSASRNIPEEDLHIPAYNGGLFRTSPDSDDSPEARFLATHTVGDEHLARVIELLTRSQTGSSEKIFVDYSSLDVRHLGSVYEGLLEYQLNVADEPLTLDDGEYVLADEGDEVVVVPDEVYLTTDSGERKATGSYYTPEYVVEYIVENTLEPLVEDIREDLIGYDSYENESGFAEEFAERIFELKILDPAMGSGHFLTNAIDYLAREIIDAQERQAEQQGVETVGQGQDINWARRQVAQHCIYGVDLNPLAVELAKVSLWLRTLAAEQPLAFLDHHLKTGNSLVGSDIESIDELETDANGGPNASLADFGAVRRGTIDHLMDVYEEFIAIENTDLADAKEMERKYREIERDDLRNRLVAMVNVKTAEPFDLDLPSGAYERMARALDSESKWADVAATDWFQAAQTTAKKHNFLHWKLEFPEVFYEVDGSDLANPGFDAVIGNPPYVRIQRIDDTVADWLFDQYQTCSQKVDLSVPFLELAIDLISETGIASYISTSQWLATDYGQAAREYLGKGHIRRMIDLGTLPVFEGISTYPAIFFLEATPRESLEYAEVVDEEQLNMESLRELDLREFGYDRFGSESWVLEGLDLRATLDRVDATEPLSEWGNFNIGAITGMDEVFVVTDEDVKKHGLESDLIYPHAHRGEEITKYGRVTPENRVIYPYEAGNDGGATLIPEHRLEAEYPNIHTYLRSYEDELRERRDSRKYYADGPDWYQFLRQGRYDYINVKKLLARGVATESCVGLLDEGSIFSGNNCPGFVPSDDIPGDVTYLLGLLNSTLISEYLQQVCPAKMQDYIRLNAGDLNSIPIHSITFNTPADRRRELVEQGNSLFEAYILGDTSLDEFNTFVDTQLKESRSDVVHDLLSGIAVEMADLVAERKALNLDFADHLGTYGDGPTLGDLYQPPAGLADSILTDTAAERENLRVGGVTVAEAESKLVVRATSRYKPENPEECETDRWDYTETDPEPVMEFVGLSDAEYALIRAFVPHAVSEAGGFAGFRETATKTNSLVDRLEVLTLPDLSDVEDGLERYQRDKQRAEEFDKKIEKADELIDQIVYQLYGLNDEEIEIVEEAVVDD